MFDIRRARSVPRLASAMMLFVSALVASRATEAREIQAWPSIYEMTDYWRLRKLAARRELPRNTEIHEFWVVCSRGFIANPHTGRGCVEPLPRGVNPTLITEIPRSAGTWGSTKGAVGGGGAAGAGAAGGSGSGTR